MGHPYESDLDILGAYMLTSRNYIGKTTCITLKSHKIIYEHRYFSLLSLDIFISNFFQSPLFLYVSYQGPHTPLQAPQRYLDMYEGVFKDGDRTVLAGIHKTGAKLTTRLNMFRI